MSANLITFPIKLNEALDLYSKNKSFNQMSIHRREQYMLPFKTMDLMEAELKNLDIMSMQGNSQENRNTIDRLKIVRRNGQIQKDFFSMAEYLIYAVNKQIELDYYKKHRKGSKRLIAIFE